MQGAALTDNAFNAPIGNGTAGSIKALEAKVPKIKIWTNSPPFVEGWGNSAAKPISFPRVVIC
jgi:hypothetical protein